MDTVTEKRYHFGPNVVIGIGILGLGVALLLDRLGVARAWEIFRYWPVLIIALGASVVWQAVRGGPDAGARRDRWMISPGLVLLLVFLGFAFNHADGNRTNRSSSADGSSLQLSAVLGSNRLTGNSDRFHDARATSVMGHSVLDLRNTKMAVDQNAVVDAFVMMGELEVRVPQDWVVELETSSIMGDVNDRRAASVADSSAAGDSAATTPSSNSSRLIVRGTVFMGNIVVKS